MPEQSTPERYRFTTIDISRIAETLGWNRENKTDAATAPTEITDAATLGTLLRIAQALEAIAAPFLFLKQHLDDEARISQCTNEHQRDLRRIIENRRTEVRRLKARIKKMQEEVRHEQDS